MDEGESRNTELRAVSRSVFQTLFTGPIRGERDADAAERSTCTQSRSHGQLNPPDGFVFHRRRRRKTEIALRNNGQGAGEEGREEGDDGREGRES